MWTYDDCTVAAVVNFSVGLLTIVAVGFLRITNRPQTWYASLRKAPWTPPAWVFPFAWVHSYGFLAGAGTFATCYAHLFGLPSTTVMVTYYLQFPLHLAWAALFWGRRNPMAGLVVLLLAAGLAVAMAVSMWSIYWVPGILAAPYVAWLMLATSLNVYVVLNNPSI
jgi:tryptophan-rich sensory protein